MRPTCYLLLMPIVALTACGQTGALYLPDEGVETPVEVRSGAAPATEPEAAPAPGPEDKDEDRDQPSGR